MEMGRNDDEEQERALAELSRLICNLLLRDSSVVDGGTQLEIHLGSADFQEKLSVIVGQAFSEMPKDLLMAILLGKARAERRMDNLPVLADDDLPPGFSSN